MRDIIQNMIILLEYIRLAMLLSYIYIYDSATSSDFDESILLGTSCMSDNFSVVLALLASSVLKYQNTRFC